MTILTLHAGEPAWDNVACFAADCPWRAGAFLAELMRTNRFAEWERVFAAFDAESPIGFCTLTAKDEMPESCVYTPFIGFVYVDAAYRGRRISEQMIAAASDYAKSLGYTAVYLTSDEQGLYEKYGFELHGTVETAWHEMTQLFVKPL
ncbi:MAG: GNAT family N-acetyltransferase [Oscillospiraceae bacterium]|nr:GNAT family N-acetyltransferase [Oscillospiraceae bacterium]